MGSCISQLSVILLAFPPSFFYLPKSAGLQHRTHTPMQPHPGKAQPGPSPSSPTTFQVEKFPSGQVNCLSLLEILENIIPSFFLSNGY